MHIVEILQRWTESNAFFTWLRESPSVWAYPFVFFVHTLGLTFAAGASVIIDARLLGAARRLPVAPFARFYGAIWVGIVFTVLSGVVMLVSDPETKLTNRLFPVKMLFVLVAIVLTALLRSRMSSVDDAESTVPPRMRALAALSLLCWLGAIASGKFAAYF